MQNSIVARLTALAFAVAALSFSPVAQANELPPEKQALLLLRALSFDRALQARTKAAVVVVIAFDPESAPSENSRRVLTVSLETLGRTMEFGGKPVKTVAIPYYDATNFTARLKGQNAVALYVTPGLPDAVHELSGIARAQRLLTFTGSADAVRAGLSIGLVMAADDRPQLMVNLRAAMNEGADLDSAFLRVAEVLR